MTPFYYHNLSNRTELAVFGHCHNSAFFSKRKYPCVPLR